MSASTSRAGLLNAFFFAAMVIRCADTTTFSKLERRKFSPWRADTIGTRDSAGVHRVRGPGTAVIQARRLHTQSGCGRPAGGQHG